MATGLAVLAGGGGRASPRRPLVTSGGCVVVEGGIGGVFCVGVPPPVPLPQSPASHPSRAGQRSRAGLADRPPPRPLAFSRRLVCARTRVADALGAGRAAAA